MTSGLDRIRGRLAELSPKARRRVVRFGPWVALVVMAWVLSWFSTPTGAEGGGEGPGIAQGDSDGVELDGGSRPLLDQPGGAAAAVGLDGAGDDPRRSDPDPHRSSRAAELRSTIPTLVANAVRKAEKESKGRCDPDEVRIAVHVRELGSGSEVYSRLADSSMRPASNLKLLTSAAALVHLGADGEFRTPVEARGEIRDGVLHGDLIVRAGGDPLYDPEAKGTVEGLLAPLAREIRGAGIQRVTGDLILDEGDFPEPGPPSGWPDAKQHWADYCALCAGFNANAGCLTATVYAGRVGEQARVLVEPRDHGLTPQLSVTTISKGQLDVAVGVLGSKVRVRGSLPSRNKVWSASFAFPDPVMLFGRSLRGSLERAGVRVEGELRGERGVEGGGPRIAVLRSPILPLLEPINRESNNPVSDQLFLATGFQVTGSGSRAAGARATAQALEALGVSAQGLVQIGGSGLSHDNRVTARQMTALVDGVYRHGPRTWVAWRDSLAAPGVPGSLESRMTRDPVRSRVRAKTGWIRGTSALSGVCEDLDGRPFAFSILVDYPVVGGLNTTCWKPMQDAICEAIVESGPN